MRKSDCKYGYCVNGILNWRGRTEPCPHCNKANRAKCSECAGTGRVHSHNDICWECDGRGWIIK